MTYLTVITLDECREEGPTAPHQASRRILHAHIKESTHKLAQISNYEPTV